MHIRSENAERALERTTWAVATRCLARCAFLSGGEGEGDVRARLPPRHYLGQPRALRALRGSSSSWSSERRSLTWRCARRARPVRS